MNWKLLWITLFNTTKFLEIDLGFWFSIVIILIIVIIMNIIFWHKNNKIN